MLQVFYLLIFTAIFSCNFIYGAEFPQCDNEAMESFISVANNCSKFIYCNGVESTILDCDKDSPYYSTGDKNCHNSTTVCGNRPFRLLTIPTTTPLYISTTAASIAIISSELPATATVATVATTTELFERTTTSSEQSLATTLASTQADTTAASASSMPTLFVTSSTRTTAAFELNPAVVQCPPVDDPGKPLFLPHPKSCSQYYLCYHGVAALMKCPNKLHFDAAHQTCNTPAGAKCQVKSYIPRENCQLHTVNFYPHPHNCNYYYLCEYGYLMVMQCPFKMHWDYKNKVCAMRSIAKCYNINYAYY